MHSSCRARRGAGEGSAKKRNRPGLSVGDTKHGTQRGPERGEGGCPGHGSSPHLCGGWGRNVEGAFLRWGPRGELPTSGLGERLSRPAPRRRGSRSAAAEGQGGAGRQRALGSPAFLSIRPPPFQPRGCFLRVPHT